MPIFQTKRSWDGDISFNTLMIWNRYCPQLQVGLTCHWRCHAGLDDHSKPLFPVACSQPGVTWVFFFCNCPPKSPKDIAGLIKFFSRGNEKWRFCHNKSLKTFVWVLLCFMTRAAGLGWDSVPQAELRGGFARYRIYRRMNPQFSLLYLPLA